MDIYLTFKIYPIVYIAIAMLADTRTPSHYSYLGLTPHRALSPIVVLLCSPSRHTNRMVHAHPMAIIVFTLGEDSFIILFRGDKMVWSLYYVNIIL